MHFVQRVHNNGIINLDDRSCISILWLMLPCCGRQVLSILIKLQSSFQEIKFLRSACHNIVLSLILSHRQHHRSSFWLFSYKDYNRLPLFCPVSLASSPYALSNVKIQFSGVPVIVLHCLLVYVIPRSFIISSLHLLSIILYIVTSFWEHISAISVLLIYLFINIQ